MACGGSSRRITASPNEPDSTLDMCCSETQEQSWGANCSCRPYSDNAFLYSCSTKDTDLPLRISLLARTPDRGHGRHRGLSALAAPWILLIASSLNLADTPDETGSPELLSSLVTSAITSPTRGRGGGSGTEGTAWLQHVLAIHSTMSMKIRNANGSIRKTPSTAYGH